VRWVRWVRAARRVPTQRAALRRRQPSIRSHRLPCRHSPRPRPPHHAGPPNVSRAGEPSHPPGERTSRDRRLRLRYTGLTLSQPHPPSSTPHPSAQEPPCKRRIGESFVWCFGRSHPRHYVSHRRREPQRRQHRPPPKPARTLSTTCPRNRPPTVASLGRFGQGRSDPAVDEEAV